MSDKIRIEVSIAGKPGSNTKRAFVSPKTGKAHIVDKAPGKASYTAIVAFKAEVEAKAQNWEIAEGPLKARYVFTYARPKGHYGTGKNAKTVKPGAPWHHVQKPDATNLLKCTEDALKGVIWVDDSQVVETVVRKRWGARDSVTIEVERIDTADEMAPRFSGPLHGQTTFWENGE